MPHEIHVSERRSFRGCRRRWDWAYREGFLPDRPIKALEFGIAYHTAMQEFYSPERWDSTTYEEKLVYGLEAFINECEKQKAKYLDHAELRELPEEVESDYNERVDLGAGMLAYHAEYVHTKMDNWFKPVAVEIPFSVPVSDPDAPGQFLFCENSPHCGQNHKNYGLDAIVTYDGRVDLLVEDIRYGGYFIWDHKTASQLAKDDGFLQLDDQIGSYAWALKHVLNLDIRGFIYAETRKDFPRPPAQLKRLMGGRSFSTAQNQATSLELYEPFVFKHDPVAYAEGAYDAYLNFLRSAEATQFSQRFVIVKSDAELENIGRNIALEAADMVDSHTRIYPSVGRYTCSTCAFRQPCLAKFQDEDETYLLESNYIKTDRRYWMEQQRSSEKSAK